MSEMKSKGLNACEEALQRILNGSPHVPEYVGLDVSKLTASIVSHEAGFDRGYLKKSRKSHLSILARIEAAREGFNSSSLASGSKSIAVMKNKIAILERDLVLACSQRDRVLVQNLQLWERVRELERAALNKSSNKVHRMHQG